MSFSLARTGAVLRKELREFRHNRLIVGTMAFLPLLFIVIPISDLFRHAAPAVVHAQTGAALLLLLVTSVIIPATISAYSVVGEREQGTLEPVLTTPVRREELLVGKAAAALIPAVAVAYLIFIVVAVAVRIGADQTVVNDIWQAPTFLTHALFAPLLSAWSIWACIAISTRSSDVRVAQQLGTLASLPPLGIVALITFQVIQPSVTVAIILACVLAALDAAGWMLVGRLFDRERLISGARPVRSTP
ncbi:MAG: ABC transporter permease subunit [Candidatus Dormibacteraeota bacterium]|nr:ABC transporter permease subunit [Candidatus Dormibacteraeota bacterium]